MNKQITVFSAVVIKDGKVLMTLRKEDELPEAHLKWEFPGGKCDFGETPEEAIVREVLEETGIRVKVKKMLPDVFTNYWKYPWGQQQTLCFIFECNFVEEEKEVTDHHVEKSEWIELDKIPSLESLPGTNEIIQKVLNKN